MKDHWGKIWLLAIALALVGLSVSLWWQGGRVPQESQATYLAAEAARLLSCKPYLLNEGLQLDYNDNGAPEYLFSCDSSLSTVHRQFIWLEVRRKKVQVLLKHTEAGWEVGSVAGAQEGISWLIDRRRGRLLALPIAENGSFAEPVELIWDTQANCLRSVEP